MYNTTPNGWSPTFTCSNCPGLESSDCCGGNGFAQSTFPQNFINPNFFASNGWSGSRNTPWNSFTNVGSTWNNPWNNPWNNTWNNPWNSFNGVNSFNTPWSNTTNTPWNNFANAGSTWNNPLNNPLNNPWNNFNGFNGFNTPWSNTTNTPWNNFANAGSTWNNPLNNPWNNFNGFNGFNTPWNNFTPGATTNFQPTTNTHQTYSGSVTTPSGPVHHNNAHFVTSATPGHFGGNGGSTNFHPSFHAPQSTNYHGSVTNTSPFMSTEQTNAHTNPTLHEGGCCRTAETNNDCLPQGVRVRSVA